MGSVDGPFCNNSTLRPAIGSPAARPSNWMLFEDHPTVTKSPCVEPFSCQWKRPHGVHFSFGRFSSYRQTGPNVAAEITSGKCLAMEQERECEP